jgi:diguanylate cyclase (GGDEF)-like protein
MSGTGAGSSSPGEVVISADDRAAAREQGSVSIKFAMLGACAGLTSIVAIATVAACLLFPDLRGWELALVSTGVALVLLLPFVIVLTSFSARDGLDQLAGNFARERMLQVEAVRREFATRLANALEMAETEVDVLDVLERTLRRSVPDLSTELLLADNSHSHLEQMLVASPEGEAPGCPVAEPHQCVAARGSRTMVFPDSEEIDACPKLRDRPGGPCFGVCVPVAIAGRSVGVLHIAGPIGRVPDDDIVTRVEAMSHLVGTRLAMVRVLTEREFQASTDPLTGLLNRRMLENHARALRLQQRQFSVAMGDLDLFKKLNDTYGHDTGDRALRAFSGVLRATLREEDLAGRYGGEEFLILLPDCSPATAHGVLERVRLDLGPTILQGGLPTFTVSFGVVADDPDVPLDEIVARADAALYQAKEAGRDRIVEFAAGSLHAVGSLPSAPEAIARS